MRRGYEAADVDAALARLTAERAVDDRRAADAWVRAKGRLRIARELAKAGIDDTVARETLADLFENVDERQLIADALARRLRGRPLGTDRKVLQRLYRYLVSQGFSSQAVLAVLKASKGSFSTIDDHDVE
jgi:SOS response regulatory protein OraA/RecX